MNAEGAWPATIPMAPSAADAASSSRPWRMSAVLGSAGHDHDAFADPDAFLVQRDDWTQLSFGDGIRHCIGTPLVRIVAPIGINALLDVADLSLAGIVQWQTDPYLRAMTSLPLALGRS